MLRCTKRYHELLFMIDTCEAESMYLKIQSPNVISVASSKTGEPSLSHHNDKYVGVSVIDSFTNFNLEQFEHIQRKDSKSIWDLFMKYDHKLIHSHANYKSRMVNRRLQDVKIVDFFGGVQSVELTEGNTRVIDYDGEVGPEIVSMLGESFDDNLEWEPKAEEVRRLYELKPHSMFELIELNFVVGLGIFITILVCSFI